ncbi:MAG TPA: helix-turn-helix domain-containing protein, partial [Acidimicrobiales bacterium]|nr:helix-turn-helix domain-containing protein [Acidimicrobiales bacterium]
AGRALAAARAAGRQGWWRPGQVALDIVVLDDPELGDVVLSEHLGSLDVADPRAAVLVQTLVTWLDRGQRLDPTARALTVHPNTVRHRLGRLAALTGLAAPTDFRQRAHVWWAAQRWLAIHRDTARPGGATPPGTDR